MACSRSRARLPLICSCPDWAGMCKHVAAVLYGVGSRLDSQPELLFLLRDVDAQELIAAEMALPDAAAVTAGDTLADDQLGAIFGIDLDTETDAPPRPANATAETTPRHQACRSNQNTAASARCAGPQNRPSRDTCRPLPTSCPQRDPPGAIPPTHDHHDTRGGQGCHQPPAKDSPHRQIGRPTAPTAGTIRRPICRTAWCFTCDCVPMGSHTRARSTCKPVC